MTIEWCQFLFGFQSCTNDSQIGLTFSRGMANILETNMAYFRFNILISFKMASFLNSWFYFLPIKNGKQNESDNKFHNLFQKAHIEFQTKHTERIFLSLSKNY